MRIVPLLVVALLGIGCVQPPITIQFTPQTQVPASASLSSTKVQIPAGIAIGVQVTPMQSGQEMDANTTVTFTPADSGVIGIASSSQKDGTFVIYGARPGTTTIMYSINGSSAGQLQAVVTAPITD